MNNQKENIAKLKIGLIATRVALVTDVVVAPLLIALRGEVGFCYGGLGALLAIGYIDLYLSNRLQKIENSETPRPK